MESPTSEKNFKVAGEVINSIKLEGSGLTPKEDIEIKEISQAIGETFVKLYGKYMPSEKRKSPETLPERIIILSEDKYKNFREKLTGSKKIAKSPAPAYYDSKEDLIVINKDYVETIVENTKFTGTSSIDVYSGLIAQEVAHRFQDHNLARMFLELGSSYYALEVLKSMKKRVVTESISTRRANLYEHLVKEAGDNVHKTYFGTSNENEKYYVYGVLNESREELLKLFPRN